MKKRFSYFILVTLIILLGFSEQVEASESRILGQNRFETAVEVSKKSWNKADTVVLARGDNFADALTSSPLAFSVNGPILLTNSEAIPYTTLQEIKRLQAKNVIIVGGTNAITPKVESHLKSLGVKVERLYGRDRVETSIEVAKYMNPTHSNVIVANKDNYPDALVIASHAARNTLPIILLDSKSVNNKDVVDYLKSVENTLVIGGTGVLDNNVLSKLPNPTRIAGASRYHTSVEVAERYFSNSNEIMIVTGEDYADALAGSVLAAKMNIPIILVKQNKADNVVKQYVKEKKLTRYLIVGGTKAVDSSISKKINSPIIDRNSEFIRVVDKKNHLSKNFVPKNMVVPNVRFSTTISERKHLVKEAAGALEKMFSEADKAGVKLYAQSGYRSYSTQESLYRNYVKRYGEAEANRFSAKPGQSEHQTALAMDVTSASVNYDLVERFGTTKEGKWVAEHAASFGFVISYPKGKEHLTGYIYEPWHLRYVGVEHALFMKKNDLILSQYLNEY
ncbi:cell wall-binding repeat-containing protein [Sutcliffiella halmapala]|uniref:cell wall-binding repeat-containing protein n=1 Tax=Sutcliffiella halmapala TaxID=79882 RepID=UPI0009956947|nr:cell wall-binding repeat-containing protein [Sutcliffiella halmapala]